MIFNDKILILVCLNIGLVLTTPSLRKVQKRSTCNACHPTVEGKVNVHLVPHSHDDAGWLRTVDQYYYGGSPYSFYGTAGVQYVISSTVEALLKDPSRRYIQVETVFFWKWWQNQSDKVKQEYIDLVNSGQLEIINGGWSMNDEAATNYQSIIDQFTWGFRILDDTLGECARPKVGWQIDPFGHSREHASILNQFGFEGLVEGRIDFRDHTKRNGDQTLDLLWKTSDSLDNPYFFTTMYPNSYLTDDGFNFDIIYNSEPINDDINSPYYNLQNLVDRFVGTLNFYRTFYNHSQMLIPMGGDFTYQAAEIDYTNIDKLIKGFENHDTYHLKYSTPSCYIEAVNAELTQNSKDLTLKDDDFFPYGSDDHSFWTGYFTSRPTNKRNERMASNILQAVKQLTSFAKVDGNDQDESVVPLREALGVLQHHDAITGTEKQYVSQDYMRMLATGIKLAEEPIGVILGDLVRKGGDDQIDLKLSTCLLANISICDTAKKDKFLITVYNPLSRPVSHYVRLPVESVEFRITGPDGEEEYDVFDSISSFYWVNESSTPNPYNLVFNARDLPPLGVKLYYVEKLGTKKLHNYKPFKDLKASDEELSFGTETNGFTVDAVTGNLTSVTLNGRQLDIIQEILYYAGFNGNNTQSQWRSSGAYIFRPTSSEAEPITRRIVSLQGAYGELSDQVIQVFNDEVTQIIRVYKGADDSYIEFDWLVGNLDFPDELGKEIISRFTVKSLNNNGIFYTDSNGREQIRRERNERPDYDYDASAEPVSGNYYPINTKIVLKDEEQNLEVALLIDRAEGGSSITDGSLELMIHRRLVHDDGLGLDEVLNETEYGVGLYARGNHYLVFGPVDSGEGKSTAAIERDLAHRKLLAPWILLTDATVDELNSLEKLQDLVNLEFSGLTRALPENVQILTLEPWKDDTLLLRLEHTLEKNEDNTLSQPVTVDLTDLFTTLDINEIRETTLGANQFVDDYENEEKLIWNDIVPNPPSGLDPDNPLTITLNPMQIRTFIVTASPRKLKK